MNAFNRIISYNLSATRCFYSLKNHTDQYSGLLRPKSCHLSTLPESKKVPVLERWKKYWQDLVTDYYDVLKESFEDGRRNPKRSAFFFTCFTFAFTCFKTNPDEINYRENVIKCSNDINIVGKTIRKKRSEEFMTSMETFYNFGVVRRLSFGLFSIMWIDNFSEDLGIYKASCSYLKPQYSSFFNRVVDVGFFGRWWKLDAIMQDYDINEEEWA